MNLLNYLTHRDPPIIKKLEDLTVIDAKTIPLDDKKTLDLFVNADTLGITEFESEFVRNIIKTTKPKTFENLVKIFGLSHGADVWSNNAEVLIEAGTAPISEVIALRDEIMVYLIGSGIDRKILTLIFVNTFYFLTGIGIIAAS